ncbi:MAG: hypothetical protein J6386_12820 [Candidatus Synoicihabitans palmerolidicus]|nr:hypothetical protein [Candidatus Synoicihabitans palmerolidicus]
MAHRRRKSLLIPSILALALMYVTVIFGDVGFLHTLNTTMKDWSLLQWVVVVYSCVASVLPVWALLQPRDYINSLQRISVLGLLLVGVLAASITGGGDGTAESGVAFEMVAPAINANPVAPPSMFPFLFITIACGAISGFHCLVSSGTSSKQLKTEPNARFVGYGADAHRRVSGYVGHPGLRGGDWLGGDECGRRDFCGGGGDVVASLRGVEFGAWTGVGRIFGRFGELFESSRNSGCGGGGFDGRVGRIFCRDDARYGLPIAALHRAGVGEHGGAEDE